MTLSDRARIIGQQIHDAPGADLRRELNAGIAEIIGWPYVVSSGRFEDATGKTTAPFACVVHTATNDGVAQNIVADNAAVVIDVIEDMGQAVL